MTINKTMDRDDLLVPAAQEVVKCLNGLVRRMYRRRCYMSSWVGSLPDGDGAPVRRLSGEWVRRRLGYPPRTLSESPALQRGWEQRLNYEALPGVTDDLRLPWFLYWEISWVMMATMAHLRPGMKILDAGGASSLLSCFLADQGYTVHAVDLNDKLRVHGDTVARRLGWPLRSYAADIRDMPFPDCHFDHAYSICVFEHMDIDVRTAALQEIARCLKPGGLLALTFDYRNPAPGIFGIGKDPRLRNQISTPGDIARSFLGCQKFELIGNQEFLDNGKSYLFNPQFPGIPYTFGALFLRRLP